jgi:hypothetical protein
VSLKEQADNLPEGIESKDVVELRKSLMRLQKQLLEIKQRDKGLVDATYQGAYDAFLASPPFQQINFPIHSAKKGKPEVALIHATDWQGSKVTTTYNSEVMKRRVMEFAHKIERLTDIQRADHPVDEAVIMFGGDMVEGLFNYPAQLWQIDASLFGQYVTVSKLLVDFVRYNLATFKKVTVVAEWGNHGRIGGKRSEVPKNDNVDRMCYEFARTILQNEKRLTWEDCPEDIQQVEIGNYRALLMHGDELGRAGFASPAAWQAGGNRWKAGAYPWKFQDIYLGHYHRTASEPMSDQKGDIYWTGSIESDNRYARDSMAVSGTPVQRLHFIDPIKGRVTSEYKVWLD